MGREGAEIVDERGLADLRLRDGAQADEILEPRRCGDLADRRCPRGRAAAASARPRSDSFKPAEASFAVICLNAFGARAAAALSFASS